MSQFLNDAIFWIDVDKIKPNPYQPRREFDHAALQAMSESIRQYGVLQALVVTRNEVIKEDVGLSVEYELIAGERRLRASKLAGLREVPCLIKTGAEDNLMKLELAIIENVQREDLNPVDRARSFQRLVDEFGFKHGQIAEKVGKSREYISNSIRILGLPDEMLTAVSEGRITEGHTRPLLMLADRPEEQNVLYKEIMMRKLTVRDAEQIARKIATDRIRKKDVDFDPEVAELEKQFADTLGTRVHIERREVGGKLTIDYFSKEDLRQIFDLLNKQKSGVGSVGGVVADTVSASAMETQLAEPASVTITDATPLSVTDPINADLLIPEGSVVHDVAPIDDRTPMEKKEEENEDIYSVSNFSI